MTLLAGEVQSGEAAFVLDVRIGLVLHQHFGRLPESLPRRFVQRRVALQLVLAVDEGSASEQQVDNLHMSFAGCQVQWREPRLLERKIRTLIEGTFPLRDTADDDNDGRDGHRVVTAKRGSCQTKQERRSLRISMQIQKQGMRGKSRQNKGKRETAVSLFMFAI